jgi:putative ABC transport system permease protein
MPGIFRYVFRSLRFYKMPVLNQILIIILLSAVITGSLLTGSSVRSSLKRSSAVRLGNTGILISSGLRYFDGEVINRMRTDAGIECTGIVELSGYCQALNSQKGAYKTHIFGIRNDFFKFNGCESSNIKPGEVGINKKLADYLGLKPGDDLILRFKTISDIPADAPFASSKESDHSLVLKIGIVLQPVCSGNFSLSINQITPMNVFMNISDLQKISNGHSKLNRILIKNNRDLSVNSVSQSFKKILSPADIGLKIRMVNKTGQGEIISDRIFIDEMTVDQIRDLLPSAAPVITYLGNSFTAGQNSTPYSFISALPSSLYSEIPKGNGIVINTWMAEDLDVKIGDSLKISWYSPDSLKNLQERDKWFNITEIVEFSGVWSDSLLMPEFPGISGAESCSDWDAGIPVKLKQIRKKDEDYWNKFRGTPKAFISYEAGKQIWGNNFGTATSMRFPAGLTTEEIDEKLSGSLDPAKSGFIITNLSEDSVKAANESVDFGTLFLSLGFFLILASVILLSFAVSSYFDTKIEQIRTLFNLGFKTGWIKKTLFAESCVIASIGSLAGAIAGYLINIVITRALNTVWSGATQTDTLLASFNSFSVLTGFVVTMLVILSLMHVKINRYIKMLNTKEKEIVKIFSMKSNLLLFYISASVTISLFALSLLNKENELALSFGSGMMLLITLVLLWRQYFVARGNYVKGQINRMSLSELYYSSHPGHAVTPVLFIAAGIFAVFITGANKMNFNEETTRRSDGTGGYLLWCENSIPVKEDLNSKSGRNIYGLDGKEFAMMNIVQMKRTSGDDASCLNLNHVTSPPLLGTDPEDFIKKGSFSFSDAIKKNNLNNPWQFLNDNSGNHIIYGIADQTVLKWGLKIKTGDTLIMRAENGQPLKIIIAAGLRSSVFQGHVLIGLENFTKYYPSVSGNSVFLIDGERQLTDMYKVTLNDRFNNNGISIEKTTERLASFNEVTNTYLSVFGVFGAFGMITGIAGLGFVLLRNYNLRKREFALMLAIGFPFRAIKKMILSEQIKILFAGITSGVLSALVATLPSIQRSSEVPWILLSVMILSIAATGLTALLLSVRSITVNSLTVCLKKE